MRFIAVLKRYSTLLLALLLLIFIIAVSAEILYLHNFGALKTTNEINYVGYDAFKQQIDAAALDPAIKQSPHFTKFLNFIQPTQDSSKSEKDRYKALTQAKIELLYLYTFGSNPKARTLLDALSIFAKTNFPKEYKQADFSYPCQDPNCSDDKPGQDFLNIISVLKNSDFPTPVKNDMAQYLLSLSYYQKSDSLAKAQFLLMAANNIRGYSTLTQTGANTKIADQLYNYTKSHYPNEFRSLAQKKTASQSGLFKPEDLPIK
jgi:hypothetical protein